MTKVEKRLRDRIKDLEAELEETTNDRDQFREDFSANLRRAIRIHGEKRYWAMGDLIETLARQMQDKKWWYW